MVGNPGLPGPSPQAGSGRPGLSCLVTNEADALGLGPTIGVAARLNGESGTFGPLGSGSCTPEGNKTQYPKDLLSCKIG